MKVFLLIEDKSKLVVGVYALEPDAAVAGEKWTKEVYIEPHQVIGIESQKEFSKDQLGDKCGYKTFSDQE